MNQLLLILIENKNFDTVLHFLAKRSTDELAYFAVPIKSIADLIREYSEKSLKIASILTGIFPQNPVIFSVLIPHVLSVFQLRKTTEYSQNETNMQNEALRLLVLLFKAHPDKTKALKALIPMIFSLYSTQTAVNLVKTVTKTVHFLASSCPAGFKEIIQILPDYEKKFLETQLVSSQQAGPVSNIAQPTITLQLKLKKP